MRVVIIFVFVGLIMACNSSKSSEAVYTGSDDLSEVDTGLGKLPVYKGVGGRMTVTPKELALWQKRAQQGPYKLPGDAGINTPGDWQRIQKYTADFVHSPMDSGNANAELLDIWTGYTQQIDSLDEHPIWQGIKLQAAAFSYLVDGNTEAGQVAKATLLRQVRLPAANYRVGYPISSWTVPQRRDQKPTFEAGTKECTWLLRLALSYDYLLPLLSQEERREVVGY
jgi:hypothetical protein